MGPLTPTTEPTPLSSTRSSTSAGGAPAFSMDRARAAIHAPSVAVRLWTSTPAAARAASTQAMTRAACAWLDAPGGQSNAT
eukprot:14505209-Alexandrium_andersonii.AAC.1